MHLATALGWQPDEAQQPLGLHARIYIVLYMAEHVWGPRAIETCQRNPQACWGDPELQRLSRLGKILMLGLGKDEAGIDVATQVLKRAAALQATSGTVCHDNLFVHTWVDNVFTDDPVF